MWTDSNKITMAFTELQQRIDTAKELDFGQIFNDSIELFKKVWLQGLLITLLSIAFTIPFVIIIYVPLLIFGIADANNPNQFDSLAPIALLFVILAYLLFAFAIMVITVGLRAALFKIMAQKERNTVSKDDYFLFLRKPYLSKTVSVAFAYLGISLVAALLCFFPLIYAFVPLNLMMVIYAFNPEMSTSELVKSSFSLGNKKWFVTFGLIFIASLLAQFVGILMCGVGILFTASFSAIPVYFIYKNSIGFNTNDITQIGENQDIDATN